MAVAGVTLAVVLVAFSVSAVALLVYGQRALDHVAVPGDGQSGPQVGANGGTPLKTFLLVGLDSRAGLTEQQLAALGTHQRSGMLTDTIMLLQLDAQQGRAVILGFPRDLHVTRCDGSEGKINEAYAIGEQLQTGGPACLVETVRTLTQVPVDHYLQINFAGFVRIVDTLGGVTMHIEEPLYDESAGLSLDAGCTSLDGVQALAFVRARKLDGGGDFGRIARQQRFIRELMAELTSVGNLVNVPRLFSVVGALGNAVRTDEDLSLQEMRSLAGTLRDLGPEDIDTRTVPGVWRPSRSAVIAKEAEAEALFRALREGLLLGGEAEGNMGKQPPQEVTLADLPPLVVLNGAGTQGLAGRTQAALERRGLEVSRAGNADSFDFERTQVVYPKGRLEEAQLVAGMIPDIALVPGGEDDPLTLVLGGDFDLDALAPPETPAADADVAVSPRPTETPDYAGAEPALNRC